jgi:hypothetical protein
VIRALEIIKRHAGTKLHGFPSAEDVPLDFVPPLLRGDFTPRAIGAVNIAGTKRAPFQVPKQVEDEQRTLIACSPWVGLTLESMSSTMSRIGPHETACEITVHRDRTGERASRDDERGAR